MHWISIRSRARLAAFSLTALLALMLTGCGSDTPAVVVAPAETTLPAAAWDGYVTRHLGRALGRVQFKLPPGWVVAYQHDTIHPRIIVSDLADLNAPNVNVFVVGMTEVRSPDGPPAVWEAGNYAPIDSSLPKDEIERQKLLLDRKKNVELNGRLGQGVTWQMSQTTPPIGDWESKWKYNADPGPGAVNRDKQRVNLFQEYMTKNPGAPVDYYREFFIFGWGMRHRAWLQIYYRARNPHVREIFEQMILTVQDFQFREDDVTLLGGVIKKAKWDELTAKYNAVPDTAPAGAASPVGSAGLPLSTGPSAIHPPVPADKP